MQQQSSSRQILRRISLIGFFGTVGLAVLLAAFKQPAWDTWLTWKWPKGKQLSNSTQTSNLILLPNGRPQLSPLPKPQEVWQCQVVVVGGSLGGIAAASQAMTSGAKTCLIELSPWLGGQISSQGVSAIDESDTMLQVDNFAPSWNAFKRIIKQQSVSLPVWSNPTKKISVSDINSCWVGRLCFPANVGEKAALQLLEIGAKSAPGSHWETSTAFKGAEFDATGRFITAIYAVRRIPRDSRRIPPQRNRNYIPQGRLSEELTSWYSWSGDEEFEKVPLRLEPIPGKRLIVIDATDTGELVAQARVPYRLGSESRTTTGEHNAAKKDNPECTQAFTFPFVLAIKNDQGLSRAVLSQLDPEYSREENRREFSLTGHSMFEGRSLFKYRRIVSTKPNERFQGNPSPGDMTMVNWVRGNNWNWMNPPLIMTDEKLRQTGQYQNWMGGLSLSALRNAEERALLFSEWLMETQSTPQFPLTHLSGAESPMGTISGLSMMPYIREGRRILGRPAYGQKDFMMREADIRKDMSGGRDFQPTAVGMTHYDVDIQGCMYRNWKTPWEAVSSGAKEEYVRPIVIPLESLIPQGVDNLLIGNKGIAVTHIVNAATRIHHGEWTIGSAAGVTAGWLSQKNQANLTPADIVPRKLIPQLQKYLIRQGLRLN